MSDCPALERIDLYARIRAAYRGRTFPLSRQSIMRERLQNDKHNFIAA